MREDNQPYDRPISTNEYMIMLREIGFKNIKLEQRQILNVELIKYMPEILINPYIRISNIMEKKLKFIRKLFGFHIIGYATK
jgi:hypothetical protein